MKKLLLLAIAMVVMVPKCASAQTPDLFVAGYDPAQNWAGYVDEYTQSGAFVRHFVPLGSGGLSQTYNLRFGPDGDLYVTSVMGTPTSGVNAILKYDGKTGAFLKDVISTSGGAEGPEDLLFDAAGNMYVVVRNGILKVNPNTGTILRTYNLGFGAAAFTFQPDGDLLVLDGGGLDVTELNPNTGATSLFATLNQIPRGIITGTDGRYYVTEPFANDIEVIGPSGGSASPWSIGGQVGYYSVISDGNLYASGNGYPVDIPGVNVFDFATGQYERSFGASIDPIGIALGPTANAVPEPGALVLLGAGLLVTLPLLRRIKMARVALPLSSVVVLLASLRKSRR